jgi:hypothetical protein
MKMAQTGLFATRSPSDNMKLYHILRLNSIKFYHHLFQVTLYYWILRGIFFLFVSGGLFGNTSRIGGKEVQKGGKTNQIARPSPKYKNSGIAPVTSVTEAVTSVTPCASL